MKGLPSPAVNHTTIEFISTGHEGFEVLHYDIHPYFISPEERDAIPGARGTSTLKRIRHSVQGESDLYRRLPSNQ